QIVSHRFDHHLFLRPQAIDDHSDLLLSESDDDDVKFVAFGAGWDLEFMGQTKQRQDPFSQLEHLATINGLDVRSGDLDRLDNRAQRYGKGGLLNLDHKRLNNGDRERQLDRDSAALAGLRIDLHRTVDAPDISAYDVHPDTAPGDVRNLLGRAEARQKDQVHDLACVHRLQLGCIGQSAC